MASIQSKMRKNGCKYYIVYRIADHTGTKKPIWFPCENRKEAKYLLTEVASAERAGLLYTRSSTPPGALIPAAYTTTPSKKMTVSDLMEQYIRGYGEEHWQASTLNANRALVRNYITPYIGAVAVADVTPRMIQEYYNDLPNHKAQQGHLQHTAPKNITANAVKEIHKILRPAFDMAQIWGEAMVNPTLPVKLPKRPKFTRDQWSEEEVSQALRLCDDAFLCLAISIMFSATLRSGELVALTWDCVTTAVEATPPSIRVEKTLRRLYKDDIAATNSRDILFTFPSIVGGQSVMVLKLPKTDTSVRTIYLPSTVSAMLDAHRCTQDTQKAFLGDDYHDYGLVFAQPNGNPYDVKDMAKRFKLFCAAHNLRTVDLYSLRHAGSTAKLRATGNLKAVQGDMGHASAEMLTKVYTTIVDEDRRNTAVLMEGRMFGISEYHRAENEPNSS